MKILIADNHNIIQDDVRRIIDTMSEDAQVEEVGDGLDAFSKVSSSKYDLVILGDSTPGMTGLDILQQMRDNKNNTRVLIFSEYPKEQSSLKAFKLGASGYLSKFSALNVLDLAIHHIASGDGYGLC